MNLNVRYGNVTKSNVGEFFTPHDDPHKGFEIINPVLDVSSIDEAKHLAKNIMTLENYPGKGEHQVMALLSVIKNMIKIENDEKSFTIVSTFGGKGRMICAKSNNESTNIATFFVDRRHGVLHVSKTGVTINYENLEAFLKAYPDNLLGRLWGFYKKAPKKTLPENPAADTKSIKEFAEEFNNQRHEKKPKLVKASDAFKEKLMVTEPDVANPTTFAPTVEQQLMIDRYNELNCKKKLKASEKKEIEQLEAELIACNLLPVTVIA